MALGSDPRFCSHDRYICTIRLPEGQHTKDCNRPKQLHIETRSTNKRQTENSVRSSSSRQVVICAGQYNSLQCN